jgi:predicted N-acetyltransferase YhbS
MKKIAPRDAQCLNLIAQENVQCCCQSPDCPSSAPPNSSKGCRTNRFALHCLGCFQQGLHILLALFYIRPNAPAHEQIGTTTLVVRLQLWRCHCDRPPVVFRFESLPFMKISPTLPAHEQAIDALLNDAFGPDRTLRAAYRLRDGQSPAEGLSFVVTDGPVLCGSISLWHIQLDDQPALLLGPIAIAESCRGKGLGGGLIQQSLGAARAQGHDIVMLVGDRDYYGRFGFGNAATVGWQMPGPVDQQRVLALSLQHQPLPGACAILPPQTIRLAAPAQAERARNHK